MTETTDSSTPSLPPSLPAALREALRQDARPVRPLLPPKIRALLVAAAALAAVALAVVWMGLRPDHRSLGPLLLWAPALARIVAGAMLILLALREGVPGLNARPHVAAAALFGPPVLLALLAEWVAAARPSAVGATIGQSEFACFPREVILAVPAILFLALLLARAYPLRPAFAATVGALGAGLMADAALHLICPFSAPSHTLLIHGGAVAALAASAAAIGWTCGRLRARSALAGL